ncbi:hypothetical protein EGW08_001008 [Elysia chlorotica]|uniref:TIR domain-containing protein n=1 Tax=Elysia chlorotica TaxID=188477 RepID=A0A433UBR5_ELYCH|nr:hypothetical protein EGW08_001008 [Elysia chlorotica]
MPRLKALSIVDCDLPQVSGDTETPSAPSYLSHIANLQRLTLSGCKLTRVPALPNWHRLVYLNISNNNLQSIDLLQSSLPSGTANPAGAGREEPEEHTTSSGQLSSGETTSTTKTNDYGDTTGITVLDASYNPMTSLPTSAIVASPRLEKLFLRKVALREFHLPHNLTLPRLRVLDAGDSDIAVFTFPRLCNSTSLNKILLRGAGIPALSEDLSCLKNLSRLHLINLGLTSTIWEQLQSPVLSKLYLSENALTYVDTSRLPKLSTLVLDRNSISELNASSSFANLPELQLLNISFNLISEIPAQCFQGTLNLKALDASNNKLTRIESHTLAGLTQLFYLTFAHNSISSMGYTLFDDNTAMKWLFLQANNIQFLPRLNMMGSLSWLNVSHNQIRMIEPRHLEGLHSLTVLHANNNSIQIIRPYLFSKTPYLNEAFLSDNQIVSVGNLGDHPNLRALTLDNNLISDFITGSPFYRLRALAFLSLDNNRITTIRRNTYPPSLRFLYINANFIAWIETSSFENLPNLQIVEIRNNQMVFTLPSMAINKFGSNSPKPRFYVSLNQWRCDCSMAYLKLLHERRQEFNLFLNVYPDFHGLEQTACELDYGGRTYARFDDVPLSEFVCEYPSPYCSSGCICCNRSKTQDDPVDLACSCQLTCPAGCTCYVGGELMDRDYFHIRCDDRGFDSVPDRIPPKASNLFLDGNNISSVSHGDFHHLGDLEKLYLNSSGLSTLNNETFLNCTHLAYLYLDHNLLTVLHSDMFKGLSSLSQLYLHHNILKVISSNVFEHLPSVRVVTLHENRLVKVGSSLDALPHSLTALSLSENPWACDCEDSKDLYDLLKFKSKVIVDKDNVCCYFPVATEMVGSNASQTHTIPLTVSEAVGKTTMLLERSRSTAGHTLHNFTDAGEGNSSFHVCHTVLSLDFSERCRDRNYTGSLGSDIGYSGKSEMAAGIVALIVLTAFLTIAACLVFFVIFKRKELQALAYAKLGVRVFDKKVQIDAEDKGSKAFDAFISYSSKDDEFVAGTLVPALEDPKKGYRVCVHYRDFPVGGTITDTICRAIESSSRTILLLSQNFLKSEWCRFEFQVNKCSQV